MKIIIAVLCTVHVLLAQIQPDWSHTFSDTTAAMELHDYFIDADGSIYAVAQRLPEGRRIFYITGVTPEHETKFELNIEGPFEENGLLIAPAGEEHIAAAGYFEDSTGTFNFRTVKATKNGAIVWKQEFGNDRQFIMDVPVDLETDRQGNVVVAGNSHSLEGRYGLAHYAPDGKENWSLRHRPQVAKWSVIKDIIIDTAGNIYGMTVNLFDSDTTHGTIFKRDKEGNLLWERTFDLTFPEEPGDFLVLRNDTVYAVGSLFTEGAVNGTVVCFALTGSGDVAAYRRFDLPGNEVQQGIRSLAPVLSGDLALVNESFVAGKHILRTFVLRRDFSVLYSDSMSGTSSFVALTNTRDNDAFTVFSLGTMLRGKVYRRNGSVIILQNDAVMPAENKPYARLRYHDNHIYTSLVDFTADTTFSVIRRFPLPIINAVRHTVTQGKKWKLHPAYPNPFNPSTTVTYEIPASGRVHVALYDMAGRMVKTIINGFRTEGIHSATIHAGDLSSGMYFVAMENSGRRSVQRVVLVK